MSKDYRTLLVSGATDEDCRKWTNDFALGKYVPFTEQQAFSLLVRCSNLEIQNAALLDNCEAKQRRIEALEDALGPDQ